MLSARAHACERSQRCVCTLKHVLCEANALAAAPEAGACIEPVVSNDSANQVRTPEVRGEQEPAHGAVRGRVHQQGARNRQPFWLLSVSRLNVMVCLEPRHRAMYDLCAGTICPGHDGNGAACTFLAPTLPARVRCRLSGARPGRRCRRLTSASAPARDQPPACPIATGSSRERARADVHANGEGRAF